MKRFLDLPKELDYIARSFRYPRHPWLEGAAISPEGNAQCPY
jgi:hypothetical protein